LIFISLQTRVRKHIDPAGGSGFRQYSVPFDPILNTSQTITLYQPLLQTIAYNLVRCRQDAEDIVQETFMKWLSAEHEKIVNTKAYLIKAVTNNCLNHLNSLKRKKEEYLENVHEAFLKFKETNLSHLDLDINLSAALTVLTAKLEPLERAVFLAKEVFDIDYDTIQLAFDKKKDHCRQLYCRARKKLNDETARIHIPTTSEMLTSFRNVCGLSNATELLNALKDDAFSDADKN
jgi:RNA polymerase sigma factor (sigma-70 family)